MDYKLAKELKDARFPQGNRKYYWCDNAPKFSGTTNTYHVFMDSNSIVLCANPTLEELIEACGEQFGDLFLRPVGTTKPTRWGAFDTLSTSEIIGGYGDTPTEAVARLWLALKKEKKL